MKCPVCKTTDLVMSERQGIEIDYCPECRGIWLDRGELDKIIDKSVQHDMPVQGKSKDDHKHYQHRDHHDDDYKYRKRKHWLSELFD